MRQRTIIIELNRHEEKDKLVTSNVHNVPMIPHFLAMTMLFLLAVFCALVAPTLARGTIEYEIIPRRHLQVTESPAMAPLVPSFDGDLDAILQLALAEAEKKALSSLPSDIPSSAPSIAPSVSPTTIDDETLSDYPSLTPSSWTTATIGSDMPSLVPSTFPSDAPSLFPSSAPSASLSPTHFPLVNAHACADASTEYLLIVTYRYSLETVPEADMILVAGEGEEILQEGIGPRVLMCLSDEALDAEVVALDSLPRDTILPEECVAEVDPDNVCAVWQGKMRFFLSDQDAIDQATDYILPIIEDVINSSIFVTNVGSGLIQAKYLGSTTASPVEGDATGNSRPLDTGSFGMTSVVLLTVASAALVVFVGSFYYWRRSYGRRPSSAANQAAGSTLNDTTYSSMRPSSPFSEMLPDAYRFNENMSILSGQGAMSAIAEDEEMTVSSAIMMSEAGYSTEAAADTDSSLASFDVPKSLYTHVPESPILLGARKRNPDQIMSAGESDTDTSDNEASPMRKGAAPALLQPNPDESADDMLLFC